MISALQIRAAAGQCVRESGFRGASPSYVARSGSHAPLLIGVHSGFVRRKPPAWPVDARPIHRRAKSGMRSDFWMIFAALSAITESLRKSEVTYLGRCEALCSLTRKRFWVAGRGVVGSALAARQVECRLFTVEREDVDLTRQVPSSAGY